MKKATKKAKAKRTAARAASAPEPAELVPFDTILPAPLGYDVLGARDRSGHWTVFEVPYPVVAWCVNERTHEVSALSFGALNYPDLAIRAPGGAVFWPDNNEWKTEAAWLAVAQPAEGGPADEARDTREPMEHTA